MVWVIIALAIIVASFLLAYKSMRDYSEIPSETQSYGIYLVRNLQALNQELLNRLYNLSLSLNSIFSFERLQKADEVAYVLYIPKQLILSLSFLNLLELEDYLGDVNESLAWDISSLNDTKDPLKISPRFLNTLNLNEAQGFYFQIVCQANKKAQNFFNTDIRIIVIDRDTNRRIELAKKIRNLIADNSNLNQAKREVPTSRIFSDYKLRVKNPEANSGLYLNSLEVASLIIA